MKLFLTNLLMIAFLIGYAQQKIQSVSHGKFSAKHPLIAALDSNVFTPEERDRLRALAAKDIKAFYAEMKKHFMLQKKAEAKKILSLRKNVLDAKTADAKKNAEETLRTEIRKKEEKRLAIHKDVLDKTEQHLKNMQERYEKLRKIYELRKKNSEQIVEKHMKNILSPTPPKFLQEQADWEPGKPYPKFPRAKRIK